jgi:uncharacterized protein (TIGR03067 family)
MIAAVLLLTALTMAAPVPQRAKTPPMHADRDKLQGTWRVVAVRSDVQEDTESKITHVTFREDKIVFTVAGRQEPQQARYRINSSKNPKWIDFELKIFDTSIWVEGIYALDRDALSLCFAGGQKKRPTKLDGSVGTGCVLVKLERVKKEK